MNRYLELFLTFSKIGAFTIGGGYAMIPIIESEVVEKKRWIGKDRFMEILAIAQSAPGLLAVNISIFVGYELKKTRGSIAAALGSVLPSFLIILAIAMLFRDYSDYPAVNAAFKGIRPTVAALIAVPAVNMIFRSGADFRQIAFAAGIISLIVFAGIKPTWIIAACIIGSISGTLLKTRKKTGCRTDERNRKKNVRHIGNRNQDRRTAR